MVAEFVIIEGSWKMSLFGFVGAAAKAFLEHKFYYYRNNHTNINKKQLMFDFLNAIFAIVFVYALQVTTPWQALIFGASWDYIFSNTIENINVNKKRDE